MAEVPCRPRYHCAGGWSLKRSADSQIQEMCDMVRKEVEHYDMRTFKEFRAIDFATLSLTWTSHFIKVYVGDDEYVHVKIHRDIMKRLHLICYQSGKAAQTPITYF